MSARRWFLFLLAMISAVAMAGLVRRHARAIPSKCDVLTDASHVAKATRFPFEAQLRDERDRACVSALTVARKRLTNGCMAAY